MAGITRININNTHNGYGAYRFKEAQSMQPVANKLYINIFNQKGLPLEEGSGEICCDVDDIEAAYDRLLGVDVILRFTNGMPATLQEKFLKTQFDTVTVEFYNNPNNGHEGDWFHLKAQYYFVGYYIPGENLFSKWVLLDWTSTVRETVRSNIKWTVRENQRDGAKANFAFIHFNQIPKHCIVAAKWP